ncbi:MAG: ribosome recycling factor [Bacteroidetes bacterium]|nr:ribosome recycling factor [Bacteroidota bacterium]
MEPQVKAVYEQAEAAMKKAVAHYEAELVKIRAGKASPMMLDGVRAEFYGSQMPLNQLSNISTLDARTLQLQPFDKGAIHAIERAIVEANMGLNPQNDGVVIRIIIPTMTEERRKQLVKMAKEATEECRIAVRNNRRDALEQFKKLVKDGLAEDSAKAGEAEIEKLTKNYNSKLDGIFAEKEAEIMQV